MNNEDVTTAVLALPEENPLVRIPKAIDEAAQQVLGLADEALSRQADDLVKRLGAETDEATIAALFEVLTKRAEVLGGRRQLHLAMQELMVELVKGLDADAREIAVAAVVHLATKPDAVAVAFVCTLIQDIAHEIVAVVAVLEEAVAWGIACELTMVGSPFAQEPVVDEMLELVRQHPDLLGWAAPPLQRIKLIRESVRKLLLFMVDVVTDPFATLIDGAQLAAAAIHVFGSNLATFRVDVSADLREIKREPMALGEMLGHFAATLLMVVAGVVLSEEEIAAVAARIARTAAEEAGLLADILGVTNKLYKSKLETFERLRLAIKIYRMDMKVRKGFKATNQVLRLLTEVAGVDQQVAREMAAIAEDVVRAQIKRLVRKVGTHARLSDINRVFNDRALIGLALTARGEGLEALSRLEGLFATEQLRQLWLEAAHIVDKRFRPLYETDFAAIGWSDDGVMPAVNATSSVHTQSYRRFLQRLFRLKGDPVTQVAGEDLMTSVKSITRVFDDRIWVAGSRSSPKQGAFVVDSKVTKPSRLLEEIRKVWQQDVKNFTLPPEGYAEIDAAISKLKALGR